MFKVVFFFLHGMVEIVDSLPLAAAIEVALIRLAGDGDFGVFVVLFVLLFVRGVAGRSCGSSGDKGDDDELHERIIPLIVSLSSNLMCFPLSQRKTSCHFLPASC